MISVNIWCWDGFLGFDFAGLDVQVFSKEGSRSESLPSVHAISLLISCDRLEYSWEDWLLVTGVTQLFLRLDVFSDTRGLLTFSCSVVSNINETKWNGVFSFPYTESSSAEIHRSNNFESTTGSCTRFVASVTSEEARKYFGCHPVGQSALLFYISQIHKPTRDFFYTIERYSHRKHPTFR